MRLALVVRTAVSERGPLPEGDVGLDGGARYVGFRRDMNHHVAEQVVGDAAGSAGATR